MTGTVALKGSDLLGTHCILVQAQEATLKYNGVIWQQSENLRLDLTNVYVCNLTLKHKYSRVILRSQLKDIKKFLYNFCFTSAVCFCFISYANQQA